MQALLFISCLILDKINFSKALFPFFVSKNNIDAFLIGVMGGSISEGSPEHNDWPVPSADWFVHTHNIDTDRKANYILFFTDEEF